jgi:hypothetical protein
MPPAERTDALLEELDRLGAVRTWIDAACCGRIDPSAAEYVEVACLLGQARRWRERAAA